jgi:hypothetical protein
MEFKQQEEDSLTRFLSYFMSEYIDDVYFNLVGDVGYSEAADSYRHDFLKDVGSLLVQLGESVNSGQRHRCYEVCEKLAISYLDVIERINTNFRLMT